MTAEPATFKIRTPRRRDGYSLDGPRRRRLADRRKPLLPAEQEQAWVEKMKRQGLR